MTVPTDPLGALCRANHVELEPERDGPLGGLTFTAKDVFDVAGTTTGFGQPDWLATHGPAGATAPAVGRLLAAGARLVGRTICDELTYSLTGENVHYGTPTNPRCPDRVPGGSSSGSASSVAGALADLSLGTDCAGSVRIPASYCGIYGMRPTHGRVPLDGVPPFAPSFDTVGWFARDPDVLERVGRVLVADDSEPAPPARVLVASEAFEMLGTDAAAALEPTLRRLGRAVPALERVEVAPEGLVRWLECFRTIQGFEIWASLGAWVERVRPELGPGIRERFAWAATVPASSVEMERAFRRSVRERLAALLGPADVLVVPTSPRVAPLRGAPIDDVEIDVRHQAISLLSIAGLGGLPQLSMPLAELDGRPLGLSVVGPRGADLSLLRLARRLV
ncbi:MAG: amidase [Gaiellales bacterium]